MKPSLLATLLTWALLAGALTDARADDGGITYGGLPRLLTGHPTIAMQSEVVRMAVGPDAVKVDCAFVFRNDGPACQVRMGFPDQARGADDPDEEGVSDASRRHPKGTFLSYVSYVDGVRVPTQTVHAAHEGNFWHAKVVSFPAYATRHVRDVYTVALGGHIVSNGSVSDASYILHTGASWHGPIGRGTVYVTFSPKVTPVPLVVRPELPPGADAVAWAKWAPGAVTYSGPSRPAVQGRTLRFDFAALKPTEKDDIALSFGFKRNSAQ